MESAVVRWDSGVRKRWMECNLHIRSKVNPILGRLMKSEGNQIILSDKYTAWHQSFITVWQHNLTQRELMLYYRKARKIIVHSFRHPTTTNAPTNVAIVYIEYSVIVIETRAAYSYSQQSITFSVKSKKIKKHVHSPYPDSTIPSFVPMIGTDSKRRLSVDLTDDEAQTG